MLFESCQVLEGLEKNQSFFSDVKKAKKNIKVFLSRETLINSKVGSAMETKPWRAECNSPGHASVTAQICVSSLCDAGVGSTEMLRKDLIDSLLKRDVAVQFRSKLGFQRDNGNFFSVLLQFFFDT